MTNAERKFTRLKDAGMIPADLSETESEQYIRLLQAEDDGIKAVAEYAERAWNDGQSGD